MSSCEHLQVTPRGDRENPDVYYGPLLGSQPVPERYSKCVTVILAKYVLEPNTGPSSLFYLKYPLLLLSPTVSCICWDVVTIVYHHICLISADCQVDTIVGCPREEDDRQTGSRSQNDPKDHNLSDVRRLNEDKRQQRYSVANFKSHPPSAFQEEKKRDKGHI